MKKIICTLTAWALATAAHGAVIQTIAGPNTVSGGTAGNTLVDTTTDTSDWIATLNTGSTIFIGFDWTIDNNAGETGSGGFFGGLALYRDTTEVVTLGNQWASLNYGGGQGGTAVNSTIPYTVGATVRIVTELTITDGGTLNDTWRMWINPGVGDQASPDAQRTNWTIDTATTGISQITHRAGNTSGAATMANIVIANDFASAVAVPEPSSALMLGVAGFALILRRRR